MPDPLLGQRQAINSGEVDALSWPVFGSCPVEVGAVFKLRFGTITITRVQRVRRGREHVWVAHFARSFRAERPYLLTRGAGDGHGYVRDSGGALRAEDDHTATLVGGEPDFAPEPECVPPHEIAAYTGSLVARARFEQQQAQERHALDALPIHQRLELVQKSGANIGRELKTITGQLRQAELKAGLRRAS